MFVTSLIKFVVMVFVQNLEPEVTIDTVANVKKEHEVHVGELHIYFNRNVPSFYIFTVKSNDISH